MFVNLRSQVATGSIQEQPHMGQKCCPTLCNWFKAWFSHYLLFYIPQQTSLSVLTHKNTKSRFALEHLLVLNTEYQFSSCTKALLQQQQLSIKMLCRLLSNSKGPRSNPHQGVKPTVSNRFRGSITRSFMQVGSAAHTV